MMGPEQEGRKVKPRSKLLKVTLGLFAIIGAFLAFRLLGWDLLGGPLEKGAAAYRRGDYRLAQSLARTALKGQPEDPRAARLMARVAGRLGDFETMRRFYGRLNRSLLEAEDYFVLGSGLERERQWDPAVAVFERGRSIDPSHAEMLAGLTRLYAMSNRLPNAIEAAGRLAEQPGWESRGSLILGALDAEHADPAGAASSIQKALRSDPNLVGGISTPDQARKLLARSLLKTSRPAEALHTLEPVLAPGKDLEASWLASRAFLQSRDLPHAKEALARAGDFGNLDPTRPEPAPYVGAASCVGCHPAISKSQRSGRHSRTFSSGADLRTIPLPENPIKDSLLPDTTHSLHRDGDAIRLTTRSGRQELNAMIEFAVGSGDRGLTMVARDEKGLARVCRISSYLGGTLWDLTFDAAAPQPGDPGGPLGRPMIPGAVERCVDCHVTSLGAARDRRSREASDRGIGCERCHGPGGNHLTAIDLKFPEPAIARPSRASADQINQLCGTCHKADDPSIAESDLRFVRFQASTLPTSRCYIESRGALSCVTCHDPHKDADRDPVSYETRCLSCHPSGPARPSGEHGQGSLTEPFRKVPCPVNPASDCVNCHMPKREGAASHASFTDHKIRVHKTSSVGE